MPYRRLLFTPANHPRRVERALGESADGVVLDLEDAVSTQEKPAARAAVVAALERSGGQRTARVFVRINSLGTPFAFRDIEAVAVEGVAGLVLPKAESGAELAMLDWLLTQLERERGLPASSIEIMPIVESAAGMRSLDAIAGGSPRLKRLLFGAADLSLDTGMAWHPNNLGLLALRVQVVIASRAAGLEPPIDTVYPDLDDDDGFGAEARLARELGFQGKSCIHPRQVPLASRAFAPSDAELSHARQIVAAFEAAEQQGIASISVNGQFVDYPIYQKARRLLE